MNLLNRSVLSFREQQREGYPCNFKHADFWVDGQRLYDSILRLYPNMDDIACLGFGSEAFQKKHIEKLLLNAAADFSDDRRALYICPACGDLGCGAVSLRIKREQGMFVWYDFGIENEGDSMPRVTPLPGIGPFYFEERAYIETIRSAYGLGGFHWPKEAGSHSQGGD